MTFTLVKKYFLAVAKQYDLVAYQRRRLLNLGVPTRRSVSSCRKLRTGAASLDLVWAGEEAGSAELALAGSRDRRRRKRWRSSSELWRLTRPRHSVTLAR